KQPISQVTLPCTSIDERLRQDREAAAAAADAQVAAAQVADSKATLAREQAMDAARAKLERHIENLIAIAAVLLVLAALAVGGAGMLEMREQ
ncbi:hypothetical protein ABTD53_19230, partial [Acinetobacter baumannii]